MSDLNPYEESLAIDLAKANDRIKQLQQALKDQSSVSDRLAEANEKLTAERDEHWKSFVHWRKEADALTEQLEAARADAREAEAYAEGLEKEIELNEQEAFMLENDLIKADKEIDDLKAKLAKAVAIALQDCPYRDGTGAWEEWWNDRRATLAEIESSEAAPPYGLGEKG